MVASVSTVFPLDQCCLRAGAVYPAARSCDSSRRPSQNVRLVRRGIRVLPNGRANDAGTTADLNV